MSEGELLSLFQVIYSDLNWDLPEIRADQVLRELPNTDYYQIPIEWFSAPIESPSAIDLQEVLSRGIDVDNDFGLYFLNLCSLHKRRLKFQKILRYQPKPTMDQVGPRGLLEYGICNDDLLNSWLIWRKWIFDIDNRAGQETGYMFEPILASCLGGVAVGSTNSPVKRLDENGNPKATGRQIDCYIGAENVAYEFKIRVTIAASGQGRFAEELSFPKECRAANITPILIVLDPTPSNRLTELAQAFRDNNGEVFIGEDAWNHLEEKAGQIMSQFIDRYIKPPLEAINAFDTSNLTQLTVTWDNQQITIEGGRDQYLIPRQQGQVIVANEVAEPESEA